MNVVWSSSDLYAEIATISIVSLLENCNDMDEINIFIIDMGITIQHKEDIVKMIKKYNRNIKFLNKLNIEELTDSHIDVGRWHISTFSRLFLLHVFSEKIKKVIYIDCDMIIRHSLKTLWEMDMEGAWVMSADDCRGEKYRENIGINKDSIYTNNGLMVIDLDAWRNNIVEPLFINFINKYNGDITYMDQGVSNGVLQPLNKIKLLPISYNAQTACYDLEYDGIQACRKPVWAYTKSEFEEGIKDPIIVHFTTCFLSGTRPWFKNDQHPFRNEFLMYRNMTPWKGKPLWEDTTKKSKKIMTKICRLLPRKLTFLIIRFFHVYAYPIARNMKNKIESKLR